MENRTATLEDLAKERKSLKISLRDMIPYLGINEWMVRNNKPLSFYEERNLLRRGLMSATVLTVWNMGNIFATLYGIASAIQDLS